MASKSKKATKSKSIIRDNTIMAFALALVKNPGLTAEAIIAKVRAKFPKSAFKLSHVYWYRGKAGVTTELKHLNAGGSATKTAAKKPAKKTVKKVAKKIAKKIVVKKTVAPAAADAQAAL